MTPDMDAAVTAIDRWFERNMREMQETFAGYSNEGVWVGQLEGSELVGCTLEFYPYERWLALNGPLLPSVSSRTYWVAIEAKEGDRILASQLLTIEAGEPAPDPHGHSTPAETSPSDSLVSPPGAPLQA